MPACAPVLPVLAWSAPSRLWQHLSEALVAWWGFAPDLVLAPRPFKPVGRCRVPCVPPCFLTCPGRRLPQARGEGGAESRAPGDRGRPRAEGAGLDLSPGHFRTQHQAEGDCCVSS